MYTTQYCPYCIQAKQLLKSKRLDFDEIKVDGKPQLRLEMMELSGQRTVPQIWVGSHHVGGCDELWALERQGKLDGLIEQAMA
jgi:glutaredoxin 3